MYMSYVMNYRIYQKDHEEHYKQISVDKEPHIDPSIFVGYASDKEWNKNCVALNMSAETDRTSTPPFLDCPPSRSQSIIKEHQERIRMRAKSPAYPDHQYLRKINSSMSSRDCETGMNTSSDQGIGTGASEDITSLESASIRNETMDSSSENDESPRGSSWQDYEGDVSSNNGNSLTSFKGKSYSGKFLEALRNDSITGISYTRGWRQTRLHPYKHHGQKRHPKPAHPRQQRGQHKEDLLTPAADSVELKTSPEAVEGSGMSYLGNTLTIATTMLFIPFKTET